MMPMTQTMQPGAPAQPAQPPKEPSIKASFDIPVMLLMHLFQAIAGGGAGMGVGGPPPGPPQPRGFGGIPGQP